MIMSLSSLHLDAFVAVVKNRSFSAGANELNITQSALSQRILNLESEIGSTLFIRESSGIRLTELGQNLLRYCQMKESLELEFMGQIQNKNGASLSGLVRVAGFSTVVRSVLIPCLSPLFLKNPNVQIQFMTKEIRELPGLLESGEADFILLNRPYEKQGIDNIELGYEENVLVEPKNGIFRNDVFLDHDSEDTTTFDFLKKQNRDFKKIKRSYFDEIYSIIDAVLNGAGRAVVPIHLTRTITDLKESKGFKSIKSPVYFCYYKQPYYTTLQKQIMTEITSKVPKLLK